MKVLIFATQGAKGSDEARILSLLDHFNQDIFDFDRKDKVKSFLRLINKVRLDRPRLVVMEGTGIAGGLALIITRILYKVPYIVSSGDAIAPFLSARHPAFTWIFLAYEKILYRFCTGFIGWTPYLVGRALTLGAPRAMTAPGWSVLSFSESQRIELRSQKRKQLGLKPSDLVVGISGSINWDKRRKYCYGLELLRAMKVSKVRNFHIVIIGDGTGLLHLKELARELPRERIHFTGRLSQIDSIQTLNALDLASLPQSCDGVGAFRYSTKLPEYLEARLPVVTGELPFSYDLASNWILRIPGHAPWLQEYSDQIANLLDSLAAEAIATARPSETSSQKLFSQEDQVNRCRRFITDILKSLEITHTA